MLNLEPNTEMTIVHKSLSLFLEAFMFNSFKIYVYFKGQRDTFLFHVLAFLYLGTGQRCVLNDTRHIHDIFL
jgi:hypothetical protein